MRCAWLVVLLACGGDDVSFSPAADTALVASIAGLYANGQLQVKVCEGDDADACTSGASDACSAPCHHIRGAGLGKDESLSVGTGCVCSMPRADLGIAVDAAGTPMRGAVSTAPVAGDGYSGPIAIRVHVLGANAPLLNGEVREGRLLLRYQPIDPNGTSTADADVTDGGLGTWPAKLDRSLSFAKVAGPEVCP